MRPAVANRDRNAHSRTLCSRYTDLLCHYQIKAALQGSPPPYTAAALTAALRRVDNKAKHHRGVEREVQQHFLALHVQANPGVKFSGDVLAITDKGEALVQLVDLGLEVTATVLGSTWAGQSGRWRPAVDATTGAVTWTAA